MEHQFQKLKIWQLAMDIIDQVYVTTRSFPKDETFALTSQARRAAVALASNISEGAGRKTKKDFSNFLDIALASGNELLTHLLIGQRQSYLTSSEAEK